MQPTNQRRCVAIAVDGDLVCCIATREGRVKCDFGDDLSAIGRFDGHVDFLVKDALHCN
jgi:hypothetical protein